MSLLQCFGCRTKRQTARYSSSIPVARKPRTLNLSIDDETNVLDNEISIEVYERTLRLIEKAKALIALIDKQFNDSAIGLNRVPQPNPNHEDYPSSSEQADFDSAELMTRLTRLNNRRFRFENSLRNTPVNTQQYERLQAFRKYVRRQIREVKRKIAMQQINR